MKNRNFTDEQLDSVIEHLEGNTYILEVALQEVLGTSIDELSHEDYKYISYTIVQCSYCDEWCREGYTYYSYDYEEACGDCVEYLKEIDEEY